MIVICRGAEIRSGGGRGRARGWHSEFDGWTELNAWGAVRPLGSIAIIVAAASGRVSIVRG